MLSSYEFEMNLQAIPFTAQTPKAQNPKHKENLFIFAFRNSNSEEHTNTHILTYSHTYILT